MPKPCAHCNTVNEGAAAFCGACGAPLNAPLSVAPAQPQPFAASPAPAKKKKKTLLIVLIVVGAIVVVIAAAAALYLLLPRPGVDIPEPAVPGAQAAAENVVAEEKTDKAEEKEEEEEEEIDDGEPPFLKTLKSGVYGYDMYLYATKGDRLIDGDSYVYSNGVLIAICVVESDGVVSNRYIYNCETHFLQWIFDDTKQYATKEDVDLWWKFGIPDFSVGFDPIETGTTEFEGEIFDYIDCVDCGSGEDVVRILIKDGDIYAFQHNNNNWAHTLYLTKTYSTPPTTEYFEIPDDYENLDDDSSSSDIPTERAAP